MNKRRSPQCRRVFVTILGILTGTAAHAATYTVSNTNNSGNGSLRQAILNANSTPDLDAIHFDIGSGVKTINLTSPLPAITDDLFIFGTTQPGYTDKPLIELNGASAGTGADGLRLFTDDCIVVGLVVNRFNGDGIIVSGNRNNVLDCFVGTDATGTIDRGNGVSGVLVTGVDNVIAGGFSLLGQGTGYFIASGNGRSGITIAGPSSSGNRVSRCRIGVNLLGIGVISNGLNGIEITDGAANTTIGGTSAGPRNIIAGNIVNVRIDRGATDSRVIGNYIGTNAAGTSGLGGANGVYVFTASNNTIGGPTASEGNVISGNTSRGVYVEGTSTTGATGNLVQGNFIGTNATGAALGNGASAPAGEGAGISLFNAANNTIRGNVISANTGQGVRINVFGLSNPAGNRVAGNIIGLAPTGSTARGNTGAGVQILDSPNNVIGGFDPADRNVISANASGVTISDSGGSGGQGRYNQVRGNYIGTATTGTLDRGNTGAGITLGGNATANTVEANVISGNDSVGVRILGSVTFAAQDNSVLNNRIGTDKDGAAAIANGNGIILGDRAQRTTVAGNLISGNTGDGVAIQGNAITGNLLYGNRIGTNLAGTAAVPNGINGVFVLSGDTAIGLPGSGNVVSGNAANGVFLSGAGAKGSVRGNTIGLNADGTAALSNGGAGVRLEGTAGIPVGGAGEGAGNTVSGNLGSGVEIVGASGSGNLVLGNRIGTDTTGAAALGNGRAGILVEQSSGNMIGGNEPGARNVISGNGADGVAVNANSGTGYQPTSANVVMGNFIGTDITGAQDLGNAQNGILLYDVSDCIVESNVLSGNAGSGVKVLTFGDLAKDNAIRGNRIGTIADGSAALGNGGRGVDVDGARGTRIGGLTDAERNVISANGISGIVLHNVATGTLIQGNLIGTDATGARDLGNVNEGVFIENAPDNRLGGPEPGAGNLISGNDGVGVRLLDEKATGNRVQGNRIGTDAAGANPLGNGGHGVWIRQASGNPVGGDADGTGNTIRHNGGDGVYVESGAGNALRRNAISDNAGLGIDLGDDGPTPNDANDADPGANDLQNAPTLATASAAGGAAAITGALDSTPDKAYTVEFFTSPAADPSGFGEGLTWLGAVSVTTDTQGHAAIQATLPGVASLGSVSATATDPAGSTSEFSVTLAQGPRYGDADGDGDVDLTDAAAALRAWAGIATPFVFANANVAPSPTPDDQCDLRDACRIVRHVGGLEPQWP